MSRPDDVVLVVPARAMLPVSAPLDLEPQTDFSEEGCWSYSLRARRAQVAPSLWQRFPEGTWAIGASGECYQLRRFALDDPRLRFGECQPWDGDRELAYAGKLPNVEKYLRWLREGHDTPPCTGWETVLGTVRVTDGHHRAAARWRAGLRDILVWVSPFVDPLARHDLAAAS